MWLSSGRSQHWPSPHLSRGFVGADKNLGNRLQYEIHRESIITVDKLLFSHPKTNNGDLSFFILSECHNPSEPHQFHQRPTTIPAMSTAVKASRAFASQYSRPASFAAKPLLTQWQTRNSSHSPMGSPNTWKKVTLNSLRLMYKKGEPITMITAHDFPSSHVADVAGMDMVLVGDSLAMVALGMEDTSEVLVEEMLLHCRSVARAAKAAFTVRVFTPQDNPTILIIISSRSEICQWVPMRFPPNKLYIPPFNS